MMEEACDVRNGYGTSTISSRGPVPGEIKLPGSVADH